MSLNNFRFTELCLFETERLQLLCVRFHLFDSSGNAGFPTENSLIKTPDTHILCFSRGKNVSTCWLFSGHDCVVFTDVTGTVNLCTAAQLLAWR